MPIYLIRHGQSEFNATFDRNRSDPMIIDAPLTEIGVAQAKRARILAAQLGIKQVIASPLTRALQTAQLIFGDALPIHVSAGPREQLCHSCDVGRSPKQLAKDFPDLDFDHLPEIWWHTGIPNDLGYTVETQDIFAPRMVQFATALSNMSPRPLAVVGHGNAFKELVGYDMKNCEIARFEA